MTMLSKEAEQFIIELRMYLLSKGKNEKEMDEIIVELEDHLVQAEAEGKSVKDITGDSPREYMKSIGEELGFDARQFIILAPMSVLLILAFLMFTPALWGDFKLSKIGLWGMGIATVLSFALYGFLFVKVLPRFFHSKGFYIITGLTYLIVFGIFIIVEFLDKNPFFIATPMQNNLIVIGCIIVFIIWAFYAKTWITILVPFFMSWGPIADRLIPAHMNENPFFITLAITLFVIITAAVMYFIYRSSKKKEM
ncbi:DUF1129 family protein [Oceanobacillus indicireducens]|uniref:DUF1129 domain-containing protein n=1 Tax=Oceanobacillus indicireducens TaxID=1004261 RepID=A0A917Y329_9BACI|nr:DUF1129 family protein [Oceanobacillus indicireducens]GGN64880.1 hypothetical protein GCM10007971_33210 [Oceanobacillus indicireducens]